MKKILHSTLITRALTLGIPEKSKAQDLVEISKTKVEKTIEINDKENKFESLINKELDKYNFDIEEKKRIKEFLKDEEFKKEYDELLNNNDNILNIGNILLGLILLSIAGLGLYQVKKKNELKELLDLFEVPIVKYRDDGFPEIWNKQMEKETGYKHEEIIEYYEKHGEVMTLLYKGEDLERVRIYLNSITNTGYGYENIAFTMTTKSGEKKTFLWTTMPYKGGTFRVARHLTDIEEIKRELAKTIEESKKDHLTGAYNRKALDEDFHKILTNINRDLDPKKYTICLIDLDDFKNINDKHGHTTGDTILRNFSQHLISHIRGGDKLYRIGGDEFILILDSEKNEDIITKLNNIRKSFWEKVFVSPKGETQTGSSWGLQDLNIKDFHNPNLNINETNEILVSLKNKMDEYLYGVKYYKLIKEYLIAAGKIQENWKEKNAIANVKFDDNGELRGIDVIGNYTKFTLYVDEIKKIEEIKMSLDKLRS